MHVCMYVCMYECMLCMNGYMHICMLICMYVVVRRYLYNYNLIETEFFLYKFDEIGELKIYS